MVLAWSQFDLWCCPIAGLARQHLGGSAGLSVVPTASHGAASAAHTRLEPAGVMIQESEDLREAVSDDSPPLHSSRVDKICQLARVRSMGIPPAAFTDALSAEFSAAQLPPPLPVPQPEASAVPPTSQEEAAAEHSCHQATLPRTTSTEQPRFSEICQLIVNMPNRLTIPMEAVRTLGISKDGECELLLLAGPPVIGVIYRERRSPNSVTRYIKGWDQARQHLGLDRGDVVFVRSIAATSTFSFKLMFSRVRSGLACTCSGLLVVRPVIGICHDFLAASTCSAVFLKRSLRISMQVGTASII